MCTNLACNAASRTYSIQVYGNSTYIPCTPGATIRLDNVSSAFEAGGYITCPPYVEVCQSNVQAALDHERMFSGRDAAAVDRLSLRTAAVALLALVAAAVCV
ncbi:putative Major surface protease gp63 [Leptomonas seymouri]|uniref:Leishmanolysin n=1 Tax=Leptomonas seymouri TaxID=5684 RepID=A0A0N1I0K6_LEPSE|nr:putative Major surface protease gp63 [Leptomonas seymouri]|eukprot:KPI82543.1 putative Major surface protease gp63 [Leptomonas seymouri]